jgi:hypothetical protein
MDDLFGQARDVAERLADDAKKFLASEQGKRLRHYTATGLMIAAPAVASLPGIRKTKLAKIIEIGGGAAIVTRVAEMIRDWEPGSEPQPE